MAYIGRDISNLSDRVVLDNITASATATYNLLLNSVAFVPSSAESLTVSLNGIIQKPQSSYTVSNATIVFASALTSSDSIDFILAERAITLTTVGSGSVGTSQLADTAVTTAKITDANVTTAKIADSAVTNAKITDGTIANAKLANSSITLNGSAVSLGGSATIGGGKILQVKQTYKTDISTLNGTGSYQDLSGLSISITPTSASSKILFMCLLSIGTGGNTYAQAQVVRDSTPIGLGDVSGSRPRGTFSLSGSTPYYYTESRGCQIVDEPNTTSAVNYKIQAQSASGVPIVINTSGEGYSLSHAVASSITVMEIGA